jgi:hypothetical protein
MNKQEIELKKYRDFSDVFNASFAFISQELKPFLRVMALYAGIPVILSVILSAYYMNDFFSTFSSMFGGSAPMGVEVTPNPMLIFLTMVVSLLAQVFIAGLVPAYLGEYEEKGRDGFTVADVWSRFVRHLGTIIGLSIVATIAISIGLLFFIIPGIYLWVPFAFLLYVNVIEDKDFGDTFSRCFQLVKNNWWITFGILILAWLIISIVSWLFSIPAMIVVGVESFLVGSGAQDAMQGSSLGIILSTIVSGLGQYILYPVLYIIIAFQYYSLREQKDGSTLMDRISSINKEE